MSLTVSLLAGALLIFKGYLLLGHHTSAQPMFRLETREIPPLSVADAAISMPAVVSRLAASDRLGLAAAGSGYALLSEDGLNWRPVSVSSASPTLIAAAIRSDGKLMVLDEHNVAYVSTDAGQSWAGHSLQLGKGRNRQPFDRCALTRTGHLLCETASQFQTSDDVGQSWHPIAQAITTPTLATASADSRQRATEGRLREKAEAQVNAMIEEIAKRSGLSSAGMGGSFPKFRYTNLEDIAYSDDLVHWVRVTEEGIDVSHDQGLTFSPGLIESRPATPAAHENEPIEDIKVPIASDISQDGRRIVVILGKQELERRTGTIMDKVDYTAPFRILLSTDGGDHFKSIADGYRAYDIAAVRLSDSADGQVVVFENGIGGLTIIDGNGALTKKATGGFTLSDTAVIGGHRVYAGTRLAVEIDDALRWLTKEASAETCAPLALVFSSSFDAAVGVGADGCVLSTRDGSRWRQSKTALAEALGTSADYLNLAGRVEQLSIDGESWTIQLSPADPVASDDATAPTPPTAVASQPPGSPALQREASPQAIMAVSHDAGLHWARQMTAIPDGKIAARADPWRPDLAEGDREILSTWDCGAERRRSGRSCIGADGDSGRVYRSLDGGRRWKVLPLPEVPQQIHFVRQSEDDRHIVIGADSGVLRSDDGGATYRHLAID